MIENERKLVVCVRNDGYTTSLERGRAYRAVDDPQAAAHGMIRVVDASGDDSLYPQRMFLPFSPEAPPGEIAEEQIRSDVEWGLRGG